MDVLANILIRPKRAQYDPLKDLGPVKFYLNDQPKQRLDFEIPNEFGKKLKCSLFAPQTLKNKYPCVIYCHGNMGCRRDALESVDLLLPHDILVAAFDFSGSGLSEGDYISLGYYEQDDIRSLVKYLRGLGFVSDIGLWGRSMGAVSAIMYASKDSEISVLCLDSPFCNLSELCMETLRSKTFGSFLGGFFFNSVRKAIKNKAKFEIDDVVPLNCISECKMPALFVHGKKDTIVSLTHSRRLFKEYKGNSKLKEPEIEHNDPRPKVIKNEIKAFFVQKFSEARKRREINEEVSAVLNNKLHQENIDSTKIGAFLAKITSIERETPRRFLRSNDKNHLFQEDQNVDEQNFANYKKTNDNKLDPNHTYGMKLEESAFNKFGYNFQSFKNLNLKPSSAYGPKNPVAARGRNLESLVGQRRGSVERDTEQWIPKGYKNKVGANDYNSDSEL